MSELELPRFDFSGCSIKSDEELSELEAKQGSFDKYIDKPGKYDVVIQDVVIQGPGKKDPSWTVLKFTYADAAGRTLNDFVSVPSCEITYGEKKTLAVFKRTQKFCGAMGHDLKATNVGDVLKAVFGRLGKLKDRSLSIDVGYTKGRIAYQGKKEDGSTYYHLIDRDGNPVRNAALEAVEFGDAAAAKAYAKVNNIEVGYAEVLAYAPGVAAAPKAAPAGW